MTETGAGTRPAPPPGATPPAGTATGAARVGDTSVGAARGGDIDFLAIQRSPEFVELRRRHRRFVFPMCAAFFGWFMLYVLLAAYARDFMSLQLFGTVNVGLLLGLGQFASTAAITVLYLRFARNTMDPRVDRIREQAGAARK